ncbi:MAG: excinuclease ABC subunit UvrA [Clostridia bacterium]|nr:excinuclease ABC subunit UvrA [Clostridia bacterium]
MQQDVIRIKGARQHNLKNINLDIPRNKLTVITGLSGSGKSTLAFDTIYAEGQRRYVESLSSYARQFLGVMDKPDVDLIEGLSPAISIEQKTTSKNPRSTVGTVTEIYDYLRLLFARCGVAHCPNCGKEISSQSIDQIVDKVLQLKEGTKIQILSPVIRGKKGEHQKIFDSAKTSGYVRCRVDGILYDLSEEIKLDKNVKHNIDIIIDRLVIKEGVEKRLTDAMELAMSLNDGKAIVDVIGEEEINFNKNFACDDCGISIDEIEPRLFSFNNPFGACPACTGLGKMMKFDPELVIPDKTLSVYDGAIIASGFGSLNKKESYTREMLDYVADCLKIDLSKPWNKLKDEQRHALLWGTEGAKLHYGRDSFSFKNGGNDFVGIMGILENRYHFSMGNKEEMEKFMSEIYCNECEGNRLKPEALAVTIKGKNIAEVCDMQIEDIRKFFKDVKASMNEKELIIGERILKELDARLSFLINVGLSYLTLSRSAGSLSGGEAQRIRLATQIGSGLTGVLYVLDEPSIGLHQRDNTKLIESLKNLRDLGNTLIVVEHDEDTILNADHVVDIGPGAGVNGGKIIFSGTVDELKKDKKSITGKYISGEKKIDIPKERRKPKEECLEVIGAKQNNLKNIDVKFPLGVLTCVTGVSGSGKSSLVNEILYKSLARTLYKAKDKPGMCDKILGIENIDKVIDIDQSPIGKTPRSNPATYTGLFDLIRDLFAMTPEAKTRGYQKGRFSFNVRGGRCESCQGDGIIKIEMHFLPDVYVPCEVCHGKRYNRETLEVKYKGKTISDVLDMTVAEGLEFFENIPKIKQILDTLNDVGLGYIKIGQPSTTLSGGESQRVKLATELSKRATGKTLYILDEPTTGLHFEDVRKLIDILQKLVDTGNSVLVIEHNLDVIKVSDYIIDIGPEGGKGGGTVIATGTPEEVAKNKKSFTGQYLKGVLNK